MDCTIVIAGAILAIAWFVYCFREQIARAWDNNPVEFCYVCGRMTPDLYNHYCQIPKRNLDGTKKREVKR